MLERLQKTMAAAGIGSRRACEELIRKGKVQVNGDTVTELGTKVDPATAQILVNGQPLSRKTEAKRKSDFTYIKLHKPRDVLSDIGGQTYGRKSVADLLPPGTGRVFAVGRLDLNSEGLVLLTDDGALANRLTHPRYQHPKTYYILLEKRPSPKELETLCKGVELPDGHFTAPAQFTIVDRLPPELRLSKDGRRAGAWLQVILREGKKRQIRHMTAAVGHPTLRLVRWSIGPLTLGNLPVGQSQPLTRKEVGALRSLSGKPERRKASPKKDSDSKPSGQKSTGSRHIRIKTRK